MIFKAKFDKFAQKMDRASGWNRFRLGRFGKRTEIGFERSKVGFTLNGTDRSKPKSVKPAFSLEFSGVKYYTIKYYFLLPNSIVSAFRKCTILL